jgi:UDP-N-acetylglucosamine 2-epimerase
MSKDEGVNKVVRYEMENILKAFGEYYRKEWRSSRALYGGGKASEMICQVIEDHYNQLN